MRKIAILASLTLVLGTSFALAGGQQNTMSPGRPSAVLTPERCSALWKMAVPEGDMLPQANSGPFIVNFVQVDADADGNLTVTEFEAACAKGMVKDTGE
jgi:hypothetical protein